MDFRLSTSLSDVIHFPLGLGHDAAWTTSVKQTIVTDGTLLRTKEKTITTL